MCGKLDVEFEFPSLALLLSRLLYQGINVSEMTQSESMYDSDDAEQMKVCGDFG